MQLTTPVVHVEQSALGQIHFLSQQRLSLEPSSEAMIAGREKLRDLLKATPAQSGMALHATLISDDTSPYDLEKVLFHNVGNTNLKHLCYDGLSFRREKRSFPENFSYAYHHRYDVVPLQLEVPDRAADLKFTLPQLRTTTQLANIWSAAKFASKGAPIAPIRGNFKLRVSIRAHHKSPGISNVVRPLLDGIISSLSYDKRPVSSKVIHRLANVTGETPATVALMLADTTYCPLGQRALVDPFRDSLKWNPDDQRCEACHITWQPSKKERVLIKVWIDPVE